MLRRIVGPKRRPDDWSTPHERALVRLSDRMDGPLDPDEALWLEQHLVSCTDCQAAAMAYQEERDLLRALPMPEPPRDLGARTLAAIAAEDRRRTGRARRSSGGSLRRLAPYGALGSLLIVALVVGATAFAPVTNVAVVDVPSPSPYLAASVTPSLAPSIAPNVTPTPPAATPIVVADIGPVSWAQPADDGSYAINLAPLSEVCTPESAPDCAPIDAAASAVATIESAPAVVVGAPGGGEVVVADASTRTTGGSLFAFSLGGAAAPSPEPSASPTPEATPSPSAPPSAEASIEPSVSPSAEVSPEASPSEQPLTSPEPSVAPSLEPSPSAAIARLAIIDGVVLVGETAAYSPSGALFAFTARPADGSSGPDVYLWHEGATAAERMTTDARSVFAGWLGERLLVSRLIKAVAPTASSEASASADPTTVPSVSGPASSTWTARSAILDPDSGETTVLAGDGIWRPSVDPTGSFVVYWRGTLDLAAPGDPRPAEGDLVVARFDPAADPVVADPVVLVTGAVVDWDARWDEHGGRLALWVADPDVQGIGELSAYTVDPSTGVDVAKPLLADVLALPGVSIGRGRLAWATPPGQGGEGSQLRVLAWSGPDAGTVSSEPGLGDAPVIVVR